MDELIREAIDTLGYKGIRSVDGTNVWEVDSDSGRGTYRVSFAGRGDNDEVCLWGCTCPAGRAGKTCKHIDRVGAICAQIPY